MLLVPRLAKQSDREVMMSLCRPWGRDGAEGERYRQEWDTLWDNDAVHGVVLEDISIEPPVVRAIMVGAIQTLAQAEKLQSQSEPDLLRSLTQLLRSGQRVSANYKELATGNGGEGLAILMCYLGWEGEVYDRDPAPVLRAAVTRAYLEFWGGFRLEMVYGEVGTAALVQVARQAGCRVTNDFASWWEAQDPKPSRRPVLIGIRRNEGIKSGNLWFAHAFTYFPPRLRLTETQKEILLMARDGTTDFEIASRLNTTQDAVKKRWAGVYDRVRRYLPTLLPPHSAPGQGRGLEKRRAVLRYVSERQEELRPYREPK